MLALLANGNVFFIFAFGFWAGYVAHCCWIPLICCSENKQSLKRQAPITYFNKIYSIYCELSTIYYHILYLLKVPVFALSGYAEASVVQGLKVKKGHHALDKKRAGRFC